MDTNDTQHLATLIAQKLNRIKELSKKQIVVRNKLDDVNRESNSLATELNRLEEEVKSLKYEISNCLTDSNLKLVSNNGE